MAFHLRCASSSYRECWGLRKDKTWDPSSSQQKDPCGSVTPCRTLWVLPLQEGCQLPRWCIAMKGLHTLWNGDNKSWINPNYRMHVQVKWYTLCENAVTPEFILLSLSYFLSFRLIVLVLVQPDTSNMTCPQASSSIPNFAFLQCFQSVESFYTVSLMGRLYSFFQHQAHPLLLPMLSLGLTIVAGI